MDRKSSPPLYPIIEFVFSIAVGCGYAFVGMGLLGYVDLGNSFSMALIASSVACADAVFFLLSHKSFRKKSSH
jgi:hypothetical protein